MKRFVSLCLCAMLFFALGACRGVAEKPFDVSDFIPGAASVIERSAGHAILEIPYAELQPVVEFYEVALAFVGSQQIKLDDTSEDFWAYTGTYGENHIIKIMIRASEKKVSILVNYLDEMGNPAE